MRRIRVGAMLLAGGILLASGSMAAELSPATKRLFDAVWADDMTKVRASIVDGANLSATNEFGVRAVDLAVDKGHYDIAHYLLSVEKLRDDTSTPVQPAPALVPTPVPVQPAPAAAPVATVSPAPLSGSASTVPETPQTPSMPARSGTDPVPQLEKMWKPPAEGNETQAPRIKVIGTAQPGSGSAPANTAGQTQDTGVAAPSKPADALQVDNLSNQPQKPGLLDRVKGLFKFSSEAEPQPEEKPAKASQLPSAEPKVAVSRTPETSPAPQEIAVALVKDARRPASAGAAAPPEPEPGATSNSGPSAFERLANFFRSGDALPKNAEQVKATGNVPASGDTASNPPVLKKAVTEVPKTSPATPLPNDQPSPMATTNEPAVPKSDSSEQGENPTVLDRLSNLFDAASQTDAKNLVGERPSGDLKIEPKAELSAPAVSAFKQSADSNQVPVAVKMAPAVQAEQGGPSLLEKIADLIEPTQDTSASSPPVEANRKVTPAPASNLGRAKPVPKPVKGELAKPADSARSSPGVVAAPTASERGQLSTEGNNETASTAVRRDVAPKSEGPDVLERIANFFKPKEAWPQAVTAVKTETAPVSVTSPPPAPASSEPMLSRTATDAAIKPAAPTASDGETDLLTTISKLSKTQDRSPANLVGASEPETRARQAAPKQETVVATAPVETAKTPIARTSENETKTHPEPSPSVRATTENASREAPAPENKRGFTASIRSWLNRDVATPPTADAEKQTIKVTEEASDASPSVSKVPVVAEPVSSGAPRRVRAPDISPPQPSRLETAQSPKVDSGMEVAPVPETRARQAAPKQETVVATAPVETAKTPIARTSENETKTHPEPSPSVRATTENASREAPAPENKRGFTASIRSWLNRDVATPPTADAEKQTIKVTEEASDASPSVSKVPVVAEPVSSGAPRRVRAPDISPPQPSRLETAQSPKVDSGMEVAAVRAAKQPESLHRQVRAPLVGPPVQNPALVQEPMIASAALKDVDFVFGAGKHLGAKISNEKAEDTTCVEKVRWRTNFCIEPVKWPAAIAASFHAQSQIYRGEKAIVQYVEGRSVQMHALFPTSALWAVTEYFKGKYGQPTEMPEIWTALIGAPKRPNRVLRWHSRNTKTGLETLLEIREIDDLRWSAPPDTQNGVVRILEKGRGSVFQLLSSTDLLLVSLRNRGR
jgi:hypothetical protein